jgi:hypothetical protein
MEKAVNKACSVSNIKTATLWTSASTSAEMSACVETQEEFRLRLNTIIKCEVARVFEKNKNEPANWGKFDLTKSMVFPVHKGNTVYSYQGQGLIHVYNLSMLKPALMKTKGKKLKDYQQAVERFTNVVSTLSINGLHQVKIQYQGDLTLQLNVTEEQLNWITGQETHETLTFQDSEHALGLMTALEQYGETGVLDDAYTMFMLTPFDLHKSEMNLNQRGRLFAIDLGL